MSPLPTTKSSTTKSRIRNFFPAKDVVYAAMRSSLEAEIEREKREGRAPLSRTWCKGSRKAATKGARFGALFTHMYRFSAARASTLILELSYTSNNTSI